MKSGIVYSQIINTVSRKYGQEIQTEEYGYGLEGILSYRRNDLFGIVNGVDYEDWNPETDPLIAAPYGANDLSGKMACKIDLLKQFNLSEERQASPLLGVISRLADQKGFDLLAAVMDRLDRARGDPGGPGDRGREIPSTLFGVGGEIPPKNRSAVSL